MPSKVQDAYYAISYRNAFERLADRDGLGERGGAAVHVLEGFLELVGFNFGHRAPILPEMAAAMPQRGYPGEHGLARYSFFARSFRTERLPFSGAGRPRIWAVASRLLFLVSKV
jgi:hypothetical protein